MDISCPFKLLHGIPWAGVTIFHQPSVERPLGCVQYSASINSASTDIPVHLYLSTGTSVSVKNGPQSDSLGTPWERKHPF